MSGDQRFFAGWAQAFRGKSRIDDEIVALKTDPHSPVAIRGTRHCLPPDSPWPRPGTIRIEALPALPSQPSTPAIDAGDRAVLLRDAARAALLGALGEADLTP